MGDSITATSPSSKPQAPLPPPSRVPTDTPTKIETNRDNYGPSTAGGERTEQQTKQALAKITEGETKIEYRNLDAALAAKETQFKNTIRP